MSQQDAELARVEEEVRAALAGRTLAAATFSGTYTLEPRLLAAR